MALAPCTAHAKGELAPRTKTPHARGVWAIERVSNDVEAAAEMLLEAVDGKANAIFEIADSMRASVNVGIWWEPEGGQGGFSVSSKTMKRLAELADQIDFYFPG